MARTPAAFAAVTSTSMIACLSPVETPLVGSSSRITSGLSAKALAISSSFFSPCDSVEATVSSLRAQAQHFGDALGVGLQHVVAPQRAERIADAAQAGGHRHRERLAHRQRRKDVHQLKGARHAAPRQFDRADAGDILAHEAHLAHRRPQQPGDDIDQRGLAGAVRPDDRDELAVTDAEGDIAAAP